MAGKLYCLKGKSGYLFPETIEMTKIGVWMSGGYDIVCQFEGPAWKERYWKLNHSSMAWALRHGWGIVEVEVREVK